MNTTALKAVAALLLALSPALAQQRAYTAADYERAEQFMGYNTNPLVLRSDVRPTWTRGEQFWYRISTENGTAFFLVNPLTGKKEPAFDHTKVAEALSRGTGTTYAQGSLPFQTIEFSEDMNTILVDVANQRWSCDRVGTQCSRATAAPGASGAGGQRGDAQRAGGRER
mgnify:CR=1 FL=1